MAKKKNKPKRELDEVACKAFSVTLNMVGVLMWLIIGTVSATVVCFNVVHSKPIGLFSVAFLVLSVPGMIWYGKSLYNKLYVAED